MHAGFATRHVIRSALKSPVVWFSTPFVLALVALVSSENMPFFPFAWPAVKLVGASVLLPFVIAYTAVSVACFGLFARKAHTRARNMGSLQLYLVPWALISVIEVLDFPGLPLVSALLGAGGKNYTEFGLPTLHGFANFLWLISTVIAYERWRSGEKRLGPIVFLLVLWPLLSLSRGMFLIVLLVLFALYTSSTTPVRIKRLAWMLVAGIALLAPGFAYLGGIRVEDFSLMDQFTLAENVSPAWLWTYVYLTSSVCNLVNTVELLLPVQGLLPVATLSPLIPSVFKPALGVETGFEAYIGAPVMPFLNAGTAFRSPYLDWGLLGVVLLSVAFGCLAAYIRQRANERGNLALAFFNVMLLLSIFNNNFLAPTFLIAFLVFMSIEKRRIEPPGKLRAVSMLGFALGNPPRAIATGASGRNQ